MTILQGTTPMFTIPFENSGIHVQNFDKAELTLRQPNMKKTHYLDEMVVDVENNALSYHFTEDETLAIKTGGVTWQIFIGIGAERYGTHEEPIEVDRNLKGAAME